MDIWVNDQQLSLAEATTITQVLTQLEISPKGIAVALNQEVIPKADWANTFIQPHDKLLVIRATQGG